MAEPFARLLRLHRSRRRLSQELLALDADVSARHLSCLETGKSHPSREMVLRLAGVLELDLRDRNTLLVSAGFAPAYPSSPLGSLDMAPVGQAIELLLAKQEPFGAVVVDRCWNALRANAGARRLLDRFLDAKRLPARIATNLVRATLHPGGLRPHVVNWGEVAGIVLDRIERAHLAHPEDDERRALLEEVRAFPGMGEVTPGAPPGGVPAAVLHLRRGADEVRLFTLLTTIGTPLDVTAQELTLESFFPADDASDRWFRASARSG